jgi:hypothetical protein
MARARLSYQCILYLRHFGWRGVMHWVLLVRIGSPFRFEIKVHAPSQIEEQEREELKGCHVGHGDA